MLSLSNSCNQIKQNKKTFKSIKSWHITIINITTFNLQSCYIQSSTTYYNVILLIILGNVIDSN